MSNCQLLYRLEIKNTNIQIRSSSNRIQAIKTFTIFQQVITGTKIVVVVTAIVHGSNNEHQLIFQVPLQQHPHFTANFALRKFSPSLLAPARPIGNRFPNPTTAAAAEEAEAELEGAEEGEGGAEEGEEEGGEEGEEEEVTSAAAAAEPGGEDHCDRRERGGRIVVEVEGLLIDVVLEDQEAVVLVVGLGLVLVVSPPPPVFPHGLALSFLFLLIKERGRVGASPGPSV